MPVWLAFLDNSKFCELWIQNLMNSEKFCEHDKGSFCFLSCFYAHQLSNHYLYFVNQLQTRRIWSDMMKKQWYGLFTALSFCCIYFYPGLRNILLTAQLTHHFLTSARVPEFHLNSKTVTAMSQSFHFYKILTAKEKDIFNILFYLFAHYDHEFENDSNQQYNDNYHITILYFILSWRKYESFCFKLYYLLFKLKFNDDLLWLYSPLKWIL